MLEDRPKALAHRLELDTVATQGGHEGRRDAR